MKLAKTVNAKVTMKVNTKSESLPQLALLNKFDPPALPGEEEAEETRERAGERGGGVRQLPGCRAAVTGGSAGGTYVT